MFLGRSWAAGGSSCKTSPLELFICLGHCSQNPPGPPQLSIPQSDPQDSQDWGLHTAALFVPLCRLLGKLPAFVHLTSSRAACKMVSPSWQLRHTPPPPGFLTCFLLLNCWRHPWLCASVLHISFIDKISFPPIPIFAQHPPSPSSTNLCLLF